MQAILREAFNASEVEFAVSLTDAPMARVMFLVRTDPGSLPEYDRRDIEARLASAALSWQDELQSALNERLGEERGSALFQAYGEAFPAGYREDFAARIAVRDIEQMERLDTEQDLGMLLYRPLESSPGRLRFKVFRGGRTLPLYLVLPILENMGVRVEEEHPYRVDRAGSPVRWVHDFGLVLRGSTEAPDRGEVRELFQDAFAMVWHRRVENDGFNRAGGARHGSTGVRSLCCVPTPSTCARPP